MPARKTSYPKSKIKVLLLEGVHASGVERMRSEGFDVTVLDHALEGAALRKALKGVHILGIRSKSQIAADDLAEASRLLTVGAFCIGTNQIDVSAARTHGVPVFNAPHSNTRSVAELVMGFVVMLLRGLYPRISAAHAGQWMKSATGSVEVRGKTLGIVGYGHIGQQVSVLAETLGMRVIYFDIADKLALGNASRCADLRSLMKQSDVVTLHVPDTSSTRGMIGKAELGWMRKGGFLINTSRGSVVDLMALGAALRRDRLAGVALDVFPTEPSSAAEPFELELRGDPRVLLTPHIGGSTMEAQENIGREVAEKLVRFTNTGSTQGAVNFPEVVLPEPVDHHRILHIHRNVPGVLQKVNALFAERGINVAAQMLQTQADVGYLVMDTDRSATKQMVKDLGALPETVRVRSLF